MRTLYPAIVDHQNNDLNSWDFFSVFLSYIRFFNSEILPNIPSSVMIANTYTISQDKVFEIDYFYEVFLYFFSIDISLSY